jgi:hypothetical protein
VGTCTGSSCSLGTLGPGASATITQTVTPTSAAAGGGTIHDVATVSSGVRDPNPADDTAASTIAVRPPTPQGGETVVALTTGGTVLVRRPGGDFVALERGAPIPLGSEVDATNGTVVITSQAPDGSLQTATVSEGMFVVNQLPGKALTTLRLRPPYSCTRVGPVRRLLVDANGKFRTLGARGWAMPLRQQAVWLTVDSCVRVKHRALSVAGKKKLKKRTCYTKLGRRSDFVYDPEHRPPTFPPKKKRYCEPA